MTPDYKRFTLPSQDLALLSAEACTQTQRQAALIVAKIANSINTCISFAEYMHMALYQPPDGYYVSAAPKFGEKGDFITAPLLSPLFGYTLARSFEATIRQYGALLELGAGNGALAHAILSAYRDQNLHPDYFILEVSPHCAALQAETLREFAGQVHWLQEPPAQFSGVIFGNEVLDALPVHLFHYREGKLFERCVSIDDSGFIFCDRPFQQQNLINRLEALNFADEQKQDYISELHGALPGFVEQWLNILQKGKLVWLDYGFLENEYYHPQRTRGTLRCYHRHRAHDNPFFLPGLQDITAHVNFSCVLETLQQHHLNPWFYTQGEYLIEHGLLDLAAEHLHSLNTQESRQLTQAIRTWVDPHEMGSLFKVVEVKKN